MQHAEFIKKVQKILSGIDDSLEDDDKLAMVKGYWEAGKLVTEHRNATGLRLKDIAREMDAPLSMVQRYSQFYRSFSKGYPERYFNRVVTWSDIVCVLPLHNAAQREFYLKETCRYGWNKFALKKRIQQDHYATVQQSGQAGQDTALKDKGRKLYTYASEVIKIVDADTLDLEIDVGFKLRQEQRVRLRGINAPEVGSPKGRKAKAFVVRELEKCTVKKPLFKGYRAARPLVVVKTYKQGVFGRYIVDLYYLPGETDPEVIAASGKLLNQVLVDQGHARKAE